MSSQRPLPPRTATSSPPAIGTGAPPPPPRLTARLRRWFARNLAQAREAYPVLKQKAGIVSTWLALSLAAVLIAFTPYCGEGGLEATARLRVQQVPSLQQPITAFYLENSGTELWDKVVLTLNGRYQLLMPSVAPGKNAVAQLDKFRDGEAWAPATVPLGTLRLDCTAGSVTFDLKTGRPIAE